MDKVLVDRDDILKVIDLIKYVNIHRKERLITAKMAAWHLAKELTDLGFDEITGTLIDVTESRKG